MSAPEAPFDSVDALETAYYGDDSPETPDEHDEPEPEGWSTWEQMTVEDPWYIYTRSHPTKGNEYVAAGQTPDGRQVYLHPGGKVKESQHTFTSIDDLIAALDAYQAAVADGSANPDDTPTAPPDPSGFGGGGSPGSPGSPGSGPLAALTDNPVAVAALGGLALVALARRNQ